MYHKKQLKVSFSLLIVFSLLLNCIPVHKIFHKHSFIKDTSHAVSLIKKFEKPCCNSDFGILTADEPLKPLNTLSEVFYKPVIYSILVGKSTNLSLTLQNKAPPVNA